MEKRIIFYPSRLRVLSSLFTNLGAAWFLALFVTRNPVVLTTNFLLSIISLQVAFDIEAKLEKL